MSREWHYHKKDKDKEPLDVLQDILRSRKEITRDLANDFGIKEKLVRKQVERELKGRPFSSSEEYADAFDQLTEQRLEYYHWFIGYERERVMQMTGDIYTELRKANRIWPDWFSEFLQRRAHMTEALACCDALQGELNYSASESPCDKNKYSRHVEAFDRSGASRNTSGSSSADCRT